MISSSPVPVGMSSKDTQVFEEEPNFSLQIMTGGLWWHVYDVRKREVVCTGV